MDSWTEMPHEEKPQKRGISLDKHSPAVLQNASELFSFHRAALEMSRRSFVLPARRRSVVPIFHFVVPGTAGTVKGKLSARARSRFWITQWNWLLDWCVQKWHKNKIINPQKPTNTHATYRPKCSWPPPASPWRLWKRHQSICPHGVLQASSWISCHLFMAKCGSS